MLFASSEASPIARVGGLAEAASGLVRALRCDSSVELTVVLPDYDGPNDDGKASRSLTVPNWVGKASVRTVLDAELGSVELVTVPGIARDNPYVDADGIGWPDNDRRFFGFSAAVAAMANDGEFDVVHLNDWHTAVALAMTEVPSVFTIHTLGYQGRANRNWIDFIGGDRIESFDRGDHLNPLAGAIDLADAVVAVSPSYAQEICDPYRGEGLHHDLIGRGSDLVGICNGIDTEIWDPMTDPHVIENYGRSTLDKKTVNADHLRELAGWSCSDDLLVGMVTRMVDQKGIDLAISLLPYLEHLGVQLFLLGSGEERLARWAREVAAENPERFHYVEAYDVGLAHQIFAGADFLLMPSRFEPCGLAQMQAMRYGAIPIVTPVGGLLDTVADADLYPELGNGFIAKAVDIAGLVDALHRAVAAGRLKVRRQAIQRRGMAVDWSWQEPKAQFLGLYKRVASKNAS